MTNFHISKVCSDLLWDIKPDAIIEPGGLCLIWFGVLSFLLKEDYLLSRK